jgi:putative two-component system response regulator
MALVDVYDALTSRRVYREPMSHDDAVAFIVAGRGTQFDPSVVDAFLEISRVLRKLSADVASNVPPGPRNHEGHEETRRRNFLLGDPRN